MTFRTAAIGCTCLAAVLWSGPASAQDVMEVNGFLDPLGPIAELQRTELILATLLILIAVAPVLIGAPIVMWRYRRANHNANYRPQWAFNWPLEILMWAVPSLIVVALSIWLAQAVYRIDPYREIDAAMAGEFDIALEGPPVVVEIVGLDWKWLFLYPEEGIAVVGEMVMPVNRPVAMRLTTDTVMQAFQAPRVVGQIYAMAGMVTRLQMIAEREGVSVAQNTQYSGLGRHHQTVPLRVVAGPAYDDWLASAEGGPPLDAETYGVLARSGTLADFRAEMGMEGQGPLLFTLEEPRLFDRVIARYRGGQAIPPEAQPGSATYDPAQATLPAPMENHTMMGH